MGPMTDMEQGTEVFFCHKCNALRRGKDITSGPGLMSGYLVIEANCSICGKRVYKGKYVELPVEEIPPVTGLPHASHVPGGYADRPSPVLWTEFIRVVAEVLPDKLKANATKVASVVWYEHLTVNQRRDIILGFERSGKVSVPLDSLDFARKGPRSKKARPNPAPLDAKAKEVMAIVVDNFWKMKPCHTTIYGWEITADRVKDDLYSDAPTNKMVLYAGDHYIAALLPDYQLPGFKLVLSDCLLYSHKDFKSLVKNPSYVVLGLFILLIQRSPVKGLGRIVFKNGVLSYQDAQGQSLWSAPPTLTLDLGLAMLPKNLSRVLTGEMVDLPGAEYRKMPVTELEAVQRELDAKTEVLNEYIERFTLGDPQAAEACPLDLLTVARMMGDKEYEQMLRLRDELMMQESKG